MTYEIQEAQDSLTRLQRTPNSYTVEDADDDEGDNEGGEEAERALSPETDEKRRLKLQKGKVSICDCCWQVTANDSI